MRISNLQIMGLKNRRIKRRRRRRRSSDGYRDIKIIFKKSQKKILYTERRPTKAPEVYRTPQSTE